MCIDSHSITTHTRLVNPNSGQWLLPGREAGAGTWKQGKGHRDSIFEMFCFEIQQWYL